MRHSLLPVGLLWLSLLAPVAASAAEPSPEQIEFFESRIRPLLLNQCGECHADGRAKGGFSLASGEAALRGGDSGPAIVAGKPDESFLIEVLRHTGDVKMPPKAKLGDAEIADIRRWIELGAPWPPEPAGAPSSGSAFAITAEQRAFWSFQPLSPAGPPAVADPNWPAGEIDRFVLAALEKAGLRPSAAADRWTLIRRASFDILGLPPTADEVDEFLADDRPDAWERLVDRLLASPRYGERWGRHWLDVARYAEDQAHTFGARVYPSGYRYRDWVVRSLNADRRYDQFVREQIAGDLLEGPEEERHDRETAVGYFALGPVYYADAGCAFKASLDELDDRLDTLARGFLGLTIACARCHDHKFDPISQRDYYALAGVFRSTAYRETPLVPADVVERYEQGQKQIKDTEKAVRTFQEESAVSVAERFARLPGKILTTVWRRQHPPAGTEPPRRGELAKQSGVPRFILDRWEKFLVAENRDKFPQLRAWFELADREAQIPPAGENESIPAEVAAVAHAVEAEVLAVFVEREKLQNDYAAAQAAATEAEKPQVAKPMLDKARADLVEALIGKEGLCAVPADKVDDLLDEPGKERLSQLKASLHLVVKGAPAKYPFVHSLTEGNAAAMKLHIRGNPNRTGEEVPRRFLEILSTAEPVPFTRGSGRLELAEAIASPENPLTARVIVNRVWQQHFGRGIVGTPSNFGALGERPTHPELLDFLARRLIASGWSLKSLHRDILCSAVYRQSSAADPAHATIDPENRLLWRMNRRRLDVESWRDALLAAAGKLDPAVGGPSGRLASPEFQRRTLYGTVSRHELDGLLRLFDFPDPNISSERRTVTTVPLQQLFVLNSDFLIAQARSLAGSLAPDAEDSARIIAAYRRLYGRLPGDEELACGLAFLASADGSDSGDGSTENSALSRWEQYAQVLLASNEFTFVD